MKHDVDDLLPNRCGRGAPRRGAALMTAIFIMAVTTVVVVGILDTEVLQYSALRNTMNFDRARYMAAAGIYHSLAELEQDITWRDGLSNIEYPSGSGNSYSTTVVDGPSGKIIVTSTGTAGKFTRRLQVTVRMGG